MATSPKHSGDQLHFSFHDFEQAMGIAVGLDELIADGGTVDATGSLVPTLFFLAYQGLNDTDVMRRLGRICVGSELCVAGSGKLKPQSDSRRCDGAIRSDGSHARLTSAFFD